MTILLSLPVRLASEPAVGQRRMSVVIRLSAFIVLCIGVQIVWTGLRTLGAESGLLRPIPEGIPFPP